MIKKFIIKLLYVFVGAIFFAYLISLIMANLDLSYGYYALFMDEQINFNGINKIYNANSFTSFINALLGYDFRYGQIYNLLPALTSFIPQYFFGDSGQIIATRLTHAFCLIVAYFILSFSFIKNRFLSVLLLFLLLLLPFTSYYTTMPKPEPIQLLSLSLFLAYIYKYGINHNKSWIFLGIAMGAKISTFPGLLFLIVLSYMTYYVKDADKKNNIIKTLFGNGLYLLLGIIIAVPRLVYIVFIVIDRSINGTLNATGHGSDDESVNLLNWIEYIINDYFSTNTTLTLLLYGLVITMLILHLYPIMNSKFRINKGIKFLTESYPLIFFIIGLSFVMPIMIFVKRIWGFYLHIGTVLVLVSSFMMLEEYLSRNYKNNFLKGKAIILIFFPIILVVVYFQGLKTFDSYKSLATRTNTEDFKRKNLEYDVIKQFLTHTSKNNEKEIKAFMDPSLFTLQDTRFYKIDRFGGPFLRYKENHDVIVMYDKHINKVARLKKSSAEYLQNKEAHSLYLRHVSTDGKSCEDKKICYKKLSIEKVSNLVILVKTGLQI